MRPDISELSCRSPFGAAAQAVIDKLYGQMMINLAGTRSGEDIEALHDMRVASRRLRSAFRVFGKCFARNRLRKVNERVKSVTRALGQVRDQDVFLEYLRGYATAHQDIDIGWLIQREERIREDARAGMVSTLDEMENSGLQALVDGLLSRVTKISDRPAHYFARFAPRLIEPRVRELADCSSALADRADSPGHHAMRIAAKRLRYTMESYVPCFGKPLVQRISQVKLLQDQLGQIHDCDVWVDKLRQYKDEPKLSRRRRSALEQVISDRTGRRESAFADAVAHWRKLEREQFGAELIELVSAIPEEQGGEVEEMAGTASKPAETVEPAQKRTSRSARKPAGPLAEARSAIESAAAKLDLDGSTPKLSRQFGKLEAVLGELSGHMDEMKPEEKAKVEKQLCKLKDKLAEVKQSSELAGDEKDRLRKSVRSIRKKLSAHIGH